MTNQELFNLNWNHFVKNKGKPSFIATFGRISCRYLSPDGSKCAIGIAIPPSQYLSTFERERAEVVLPQVPALEGVTPLFAGQMQDVHDGYLINMTDTADALKDYTAKFEYSARRLAEAFNLTIPEEGPY